MKQQREAWCQLLTNKGGLKVRLLREVELWECLYRQLQVTYPIAIPPSKEKQP